MEFAHRPKTKTLTSVLLALLENEVPGPRLPGLIEPILTYFPLSIMKTACQQVNNYSQNQLRWLVPTLQVMQMGNVTRNIILSEGLTQESYIVEEGASDEGNNEFTLDLEDDTEPGHNIFASSLLVDDLVMPDMASARDILRPQINKVLQCLDTLKSQSSIDLASYLKTWRISYGWI
jgi:hypothetical protein